jgi:hypothetical protein
MEIEKRRRNFTGSLERINNMKTNCSFEIFPMHIEEPIEKLGPRDFS